MPIALDPPLSIVIPVHNEEECLPLLIEELKQLPDKWQIVIVDDGSTDQSWSRLAHLDDLRFRAIRLGQKRGKSAALRAGILECRSLLIATLDADLQHSPRQIYDLLEHWDGSVDVLLAWRNQRSDSLPKRVYSKLGNKLANILFGNSLRDQNTPLKLFRREVVHAVPWFRNSHRFFSALALKSGFRITEVPLPHFPRKRGKSKYGYGDRVLANIVAWGRCLYWQWWKSRSL